MYGAIVLVVIGTLIAGEWPHSAGFAGGLAIGLVVGFDLWRVLSIRR